MPFLIKTKEMKAIEKLIGKRVRIMNNNEKLKEAKRLYQTANSDQRYVLESLFPELKESEDEKIRKALIRFHKSTIDVDGIKGEDIIAWLEKQGEKPRYSIGDVLCDKLCTTLTKDAQPNFEIVDIRNGMYICDKGSFPVSQQDEYELVAKKIDNEEVNGEDYGIDGLYHAQRILEKTLGSVEGYQSDDGILEHKAAITAVSTLSCQKPIEYSEEDDVSNPTSQNVQDLIEKYVSVHAANRWLDASELEQLLNDFVLEYDVIKNREYEQQCKVSNDGNNR